jgi:predicted DNA-binding transcriptional regulator AlpA
MTLDSTPNAAMEASTSASDELASIKRAQLITGMSRTYIYGHLFDAENPFPRPIKIGSRSLWLMSELHAWVQRQVLTRPRSGDSQRAGKRMGRKTHAQQKPRI